jgi:hypothetical protein
VEHGRDARERALERRGILEPGLQDADATVAADLGRQGTVVADDGGDE